MEVLKEYYKLKGDTLIQVQKENRTLQSQLYSTRSQLSNSRTELETLQTNYGKLEENYDQLSFNYEQTKKSAADSKSETATLETELRESISENAAMRAVLENLDAAYQLNEYGAIAANENFAQKLKRMQELSEIIEAEKVQLANLYSLLSPLPIFAEDGIDLIKRPDQLMITLSADKVYRTGKSALNTKGRNVIKELTGVLFRNSNLNIIIEAHTDNTGSDAANWNLSTNRASAVAKEMIKNEFEPTRLSPLGRSSHDPRDLENTSAARKTNRRVELIIKSQSIIN
ncbi:MAG: OmpA family protein [Bacteroidia bacterium]|nr:OmpA family protein [Bacteroidia bacterium]